MYLNIYLSNGPDHFSPEKKNSNYCWKMQWNGARRAHSLWCKSLTHNTHLHHPSIPVSHLFTMSSLEEPLSFDKLPSMSTMDRIQRFSSGACRPRDDVGMGHRWIEGRDCTTSNSCMWVFLGYISIFAFLFYRFVCDSSWNICLLTVMMIKALVKSLSRGEGILENYLTENNICFGIFQLQEGLPQFLGL